jgi:hypothetical protein
MCNVLLIVVCPFVLFLLAIVLSVHLRLTDSDLTPLVSSNSSCNKYLRNFIIYAYFHLSFTYILLTCTRTIESDFIIITLSTILEIQTFKSSVQVTCNCLSSGGCICLWFDLSALNLYWVVTESVYLSDLWDCFDVTFRGQWSIHIDPVSPETLRMSNGRCYKHYNNSIKYNLIQIKKKHIQW